MIKEKRLYFASLGSCNQSCLFCVRGGDEPKITLLSTKEAKEILQRKKKEGHTEVYFDGGEPTMRKDLSELILFGCVIERTGA